jgi:hypothetical protein
MVSIVFRDAQTSANVRLSSSLLLGTIALVGAIAVHKLRRACAGTCYFAPNICSSLPSCPRSFAHAKDLLVGHQSFFGRLPRRIELPMAVGVRSSSIMRSSLRSISSRRCRIRERLSAEVMADERGAILRLWWG